MAADTHFSNVAHRTKMMLMVWLSLLWISDIPDILYFYLVGPVPAWLLYIKFGLMMLYTAVCLVIQRYKPILPYAFIMLIFIAGVVMSDWLKFQAWWENWLPQVESSIFWGLENIIIRDLTLLLLVTAAMWLVKRKRTPSFLRVVNSEPRLNL